MDVVEALDAARGVTCFVGAGGKKTTMYELGGRIDGAVVTATVRIPVFDDRVGSHVVTDDPVGALESGVEEWPVGLVPGRADETRYRGYEPPVVDEIAAVADAVLVKADGARSRLFKAPGEDEPQLPEGTDTVVPVASVHAVGEPLGEETVHRPERIAAITDLDPGNPITATDVAAVIVDEHGGRKGVPEGATVVPLLNMVDDDSCEEVAREIAAEILARADVPRVVLAQMTASDPVVDVVR